MMSRSRTIIDPDRLHNTHPGGMLLNEFMEPLALDADGLADALELSSDRLKAVITGSKPMDAEIDLRLARYFHMSDGFFMRLQVQHDIIEARRQLEGALERIAPRAA